MSGPLYLLDTNVLLFLARGGAPGQHIDARFGLRAARQRPLVCVVSHGEVWVLARRNGWGEDKQAALRNLLDNVVTVDINHPRVIEAYVELDLVSQAHAGGARNMGKNELWIAASAKAAGATLLTTDGDSDHLIPDHLVGVVIDPKVATTNDKLMSDREQRPRATRTASRETVTSYRKDSLYPRIVHAVEPLLARGNVVAPVDVLIGMGLLASEKVEDWRFGRVPYLEKVIDSNLVKLSRLLRLLRFHAHDLNLRPSTTAYMRWGKGPKQRLRFTKTGDRKLEEAYSLHFIRPGNGRDEAQGEETRTDDGGTRP